jgi:amino acid adenylation domain-containing protein
MTDSIGFELSTQQQSEWRRHGTPSASVSVCALELSEPLDSATLRERMSAATERHEVLRTTFTRPAGRRFPLQVVAEQADAPAVEERELADALGAMAELERELLATTFEIEHGPLLRVVLARLGGERSALVLAASGLVLDADGLLALALELLGADIEEEPLQYGDYAAWQAELLEETPPDVVPADAPAPVALPLAGTGDQPLALPVPFDASIARAVSGLAADPRDAWLTTWATLLARLSGRSDIALAVAVGARASGELDGAVGAYARAVPVVLDVAPGISFTDLVAAVAETRKAAEADQERLGAGSAERRLGFSYTPGNEAPAGLPVAAVRCSPAPLAGQARLDVAVVDDAITVTLLTAGVERGEAERIARSLEQLARAATASPATDVWALDVLAAVDRAQLVDDFGTGPERSPAALVHERFAERATRMPEATAVSSAGTALTYAELAARADAIAATLRARGAAGAVVALLLDRSPDLIAAVLGVLKAGAAYLPLNADQPEARLAYQVDDAGAKLVLSEDRLAALADGLGAEVLDVQEAAAGAGTDSGGSDSDGAPVAVGREDIAYLIYTSGSTGVPKGVEVTHGNLANYVDAISDRLGLESEPEPQRFGVVTTLSTDLGNTSIFPALAAGGCLELVPGEAAMDGAAYAAFAATHPVDILKITPSHLGALLASGDARVLPRRRLVLGGEAASWALIDAVRAVGDCEILNHYGPTETTVGSLAGAVGERAGAQAASATVPIGRPLANTTVAVVDEQLALVPLGAPGELLIGGAGVARGYRNQPEQAAERFVADPVRGESGGRVYRTGDRVRMLADGSLEFLRRVDGQLKIRGYRVEVAEVEAVLAEHATVDRVAVVPREYHPGDVRLVAYVVPTAGATVAFEKLREVAGQRLPEYMVPSAVVSLNELPLMANGKLDRAALPAPDEASALAKYVAPSTETEERIAAIWGEALGVERVGVQDDFFELGGHSLLATQVIARIRSAFGVQLPLHALFTAPRVAELAGAVDGMAGEDDAELDDLLTELEGLTDEEAERLLGAD